MPLSGLTCAPHAGPQEALVAAGIEETWAADPRTSSPQAFCSHRPASSWRVLHSKVYSLVGWQKPDRSECPDQNLWDSAEKKWVEPMSVGGLLLTMEKHLLFTVDCDVSCRLFTDALHLVRTFLFIPGFLSFYLEWTLDFIKRFASIELTLWYCSFWFVKIVNYIDYFSNVKRVFYSGIQAHFVLFVARLS